MGLALSLAGCGGASGGTDVPLVVVTTGQIHDAARAMVEGVPVQLKLLCGPGVDPHSYGASTRDVLAMDRAELIIFNGFHLEAQLSELLEREAIAEKSWSMAGASPTDRRLGWSDEGGEAGSFDPHIWNDLEGWSICVEALSLELAKLFHVLYASNSKRWQSPAVACSSLRRSSNIAHQLFIAWRRPWSAKAPAPRRIIARSSTIAHQELSAARIARPLGEAMPKRSPRW